MRGVKAKEARRAEQERTGKTAKELKKSPKSTSQDVFLIALVSCIAIAIVAAVAYSIYHDKNTAPAFAFSAGIAENGYWEDTVATDYVELFPYQSLTIPSEIREVPEAELQAEIKNEIGAHNPPTKQVTDRAIVNGDNVNIDYVGSVDGVPFESGSTEGAGTDVTAGSANYIDDFLTQIIGHRPGETFNVEVTFPRDYGKEELNGKDAVFVTTINYITEDDLTDEFVAEALSEEHGWTTIAEMETEIRNNLQKARVDNYLRDYLATEATVNATPETVAAYQEKLIAYQEKSMLDYYLEQADSSEMELDEFLQTYAGVESKDELVAQNRESVEKDMKRTLVVQAIAEDADITVSDEDLSSYLPGYSAYMDQFGKPWITQYVLGLKVIAYLTENAN